MSLEGEPFHVDTRPTKRVVVDSLTRDATVEECILDLVDNAIDAAPYSEARTVSVNDKGLSPESYEGTEIKLEIGESSFFITDNCAGMSPSLLATKVLRFGESAIHKAGIGSFGVGLNRAVFKLGKHSTIKTDTGTERSEISVDAVTYMNSQIWDLPAYRVPSSGIPGTQIRITGISEELSAKFGNEKWIADLRRECGQRYGSFIERGLIIRINGESALAHTTRIRPYGPFYRRVKILKVGDVSVHIECGQHDKHRFSNEEDYSKEANNQLSGEYGWTISCNGRVVLSADRTSKTGWDSFHTEFYGFAGIASFTSDDPLSLPWRTTKNDVDLNNPAYILALGEMKRLTAEWRRYADKRKKALVKPRTDHDPIAATKEIQKSGERSKLRRSGEDVRRTPVKKQDHHQYRSLLPTDVDEEHCKDKMLALVHEAKSSNIDSAPYSSLALLRMLFETAAMEFLRRHDRADAIHAFALEARTANGKQQADTSTALINPTMDEILSYFDKNPTMWGATKGNLRHSIKRMKKHQRELNGVLHNAFQQVGEYSARSLRDDVTPILRHLIET